MDEGKDVSGQGGSSTGHRSDKFKRLHRVARFIWFHISPFIINQFNHVPIIISECLHQSSSSRMSDCTYFWQNIEAVRKVLAALLHHLLNSASAVSSWLEFVAGACLFGVCTPVVWLHATSLCFGTKASFKVPSLTDNALKSFCGNIEKCCPRSEHRKVSAR